MSVQLENGYTRIANEILEEIISSGLNGTEIAVLFFVLRKTYGFQKKQDEISLTQFEKAIPHSRRTIIRALKTLQQRNMLILIKKGTSVFSSNLWTFNKNHEDWRLVTKVALVTKMVTTSDKTRHQLVTKRIHTKETIQKKYTKESRNLSKLLISLIKENLPNFKEPNLSTWTSHVDKMLRLDKRTEEQVEYVIRWCQQDNFWQANILSTKKLREKFDTLVAQIKRNNKSSKGITII